MNYIFDDLHRFLNPLVSLFCSELLMNGHWFSAQNRSRQPKTLKSHAVEVCFQITKISCCGSMLLDHRNLILLKYAFRSQKSHVVEVCFQITEISCCGSMLLDHRNLMLWKYAATCTCTVTDPGFAIGLRWLRFENFVCQNERIGTLRGGVCQAHPHPRSTNDVYTSFIVITLRPNLVLQFQLKLLSCMLYNKCMDLKWEFATENQHL